MKRRAIPAELRELVRDDWSIMLQQFTDRDELVRELWHVDETGRVLHPRLQGRASDWHGDLPTRRFPTPPRAARPVTSEDRFNREEFEANPDSSDSTDSDEEISPMTPAPESDNHVTATNDQSASSDSDEDAKNSNSNHVMAMLNRVQGLEQARDSEYDSDQSRDEDSPLHTPRSDALIRFSRLRKIVATTPNSVHARTKYGVTPLLAAVLVDDVQAVKLFLAQHADPDTPDCDSRSPLWWSARLGLGAVTRALLEAGATVHTPLSPPVLHLAVLSQDAPTVTALLAHRSVVLNATDVKGRTALHYAAALPSTAILTALFDRGIDLLSRDQLEMTPLFYAALYGPVKHVKLLMREVMQQTWREFKARKMKYTEFPLNTLLSLAYDPVDQRGTTPLFWAAWAGRPAVVRALLSDASATAGLADTRARDLTGRTVLHVAVSGLHHALTHRMLTRARGVVDSLTALLAHRADARALDHRDSTPLHVLAAVPIRFELDDTRQTLLVTAAELLLTAGAPLAKQNRRGLTAVQLVAQSGCAALLDHVLARCTPSLFIDAQHRTLLHHVLVGLRRYPAAINSRSPAHVQCIKLLLNKAISPTQADKWGQLPIHLAAKLGATRSMRLLLEHAPDTVHTGDSRGRTVAHLYLSSRAQSVDTLQLLLERGASLATRDVNGWTALHWLAHGTSSAEYYRVVAEYLPDEIQLLALLANTAGRRRSALHVAARAGNKAFVDWIMTRVTERAVTQLLLARDQGGNTPAHIALRVPGSTTEHLQLARLLIATSPATIVHEQNRSGQTLLHLAARWNNSELINLLLDLGADPNARDQKRATPLHEAVASCAVTAVQALLDRHADSTCQDHKSRGLLHWLAFWSREPSYQGTPLLQLLIARCPAQLSQLDHRERTALHYLAWHGTRDTTLLASLWLALPQSARDARDLNGQTALHLATERGDVALVEHLLALGARADIADAHGRTALHVAARHGHVYVLEQLLSAALIDVADHKGMTALIIAAQRGHLDAVKLLLDSDADRMHSDHNGRTALHWAALGGHVGCVAELWSLELFEQEDLAGATALQLAWQHRRHTVFVKLENLLAQIYHPSREHVEEEDEESETHVIYDDDEDFVEPEFDEDLGDRSEISMDEGDMDDDEDSFSAEELTPVSAHPTTPLTPVAVQPETAAVARVLYADELDINLTGVKSPRSPRLVTRVIPQPAPRSPRHASLTRSIDELTNRVRAHNAATAVETALRAEPSSAAFTSLVKLTASLLRARLMTLESHLVLQESKARLDKLTREHADLTRVKSTLAIELETLHAMESGKSRVLTRVKVSPAVDPSLSLNHVLTTVLMITCCLVVLLLYSEHSRPAPFTHVI